MYTENLLALDVETTGLSFEKDEIIELSFLRGGEEEVTTWRCRPSVNVTPGAFKTHGISNDDLIREPAFSAIAGDVVEFLNWAEVLIGYNVSFDVRFLEEELSRNGRPVDLSGKLLVDPFRIWQQKEPKTLSEAVRRFLGEDHADAHSAAGDLIATTRVLDQMLEDWHLNSLGVQELHDFCFPERKRWIGKTHHLQWERGQVVFGFGKYRGTAVLEVAEKWPDYLDWMQRKKVFPRHVLNIIKGALQGLDRNAFNRRVADHFGEPPEE